MTTTTVPTMAGSRDARPSRPAVAITGLSKTFQLPHQQYHTLKERVLHPFRASTYDELRAVDNVSVEVAAGEFFGIVGRTRSCPASAP